MTIYQKNAIKITDMIFVMFFPRSRFYIYTNKQKNHSLG